MIREWSLIAVECDAECDARGPITSESIKHAIDLAREAGWRVDDWETAYCPTHRDRGVTKS